MEFLSYTTKDGDRWDALSAYFYGGDPEAFERIVAANPTVMILPILPGGLTLRIPTLDLATVQATLPASQLPPWKR
jgi:phage tail protein X